MAQVTPVLWVQALAPELSQAAGTAKKKKGNREPKIYHKNIHLSALDKTEKLEVT